MSTSPSNSMRVFVRWKEQTVFAGENIECEITFKNIAAVPTPTRASLHPNLNGFALGGSRKAPSTQVKSGSPLNPHSAQAGKGHRSTLSLTVPASSLRSPVTSGSWPSRNIAGASRDGEQHKRSISIISIGASEATNDDSASQKGYMDRVRPARGHGRAASLQIVSRGLGINSSSVLDSTQRSITQPAPLASFPLTGEDINASTTSSQRRYGIATAPHTPKPFSGSSARRKGSGALPQTWKFPTSPGPGPEIQDVEGGATAPNKDHLLSPRSGEPQSQIQSRVAPATRVISPASVSGTPRSSGEFYSLSNNSTETLASEYVPPATSRVMKSTHIRRPSNLTVANIHKPPEMLMMGYAQINGSFTLDGSLISQSSFEDIKKRGAVGGQGGGVVGFETSKRESGLLRGFGWGSLGTSLGGLLGGSELSSMKDMRGVASTRAIPLLSTPQSILFVDLCLAPGESKSYKYSFKLPRGLPPTHRGKAIKISYKLVIGTQRPGGAKEQQVESVNFPFRVLGSVNSYGEVLGHDLMSPYIILRDQARVQTVDYNPGGHSSRLSTKSLSAQEESPNDFLEYVNELLTRPRQNSSLGLLSPTVAPRSRRQSVIEEPSTTKEAIDMAILRSNVTTESQQSANKFEIARGGKRVAVIMLARPSYRIGESVNIAVDFTDSEIPCYAVHVSLETSEKVDNSIALRSEASILRVTRKIHASHSESTLFARRVVFSPAIPAIATPEFITTGVSLEWRIRIEFVTPTITSQGNIASVNDVDLLEEISQDDRGAVLAAVETVSCESFEIAVPLRVYGAAGNVEKDDGQLEGLAV